MKMSLLGADVGGDAVVTSAGIRNFVETPKPTLHTHLRGFLLTGGGFSYMFRKNRPDVRPIP